MGRVCDGFLQKLSPRATLVRACFWVRASHVGRTMCLLPSVMQPTSIFFSFLLIVTTAHHRRSHRPSLHPLDIASHRIGFGFVLVGGSSFWRVALQWQASAVSLEKHKGGSESIDPIHLADVGQEGRQQERGGEMVPCAQRLQLPTAPLHNTLRQAGRRVIPLPRPHRRSRHTIAAMATASASSGTPSPVVVRCRLPFLPIRLGSASSFSVSV